MTMKSKKVWTYKLNDKGKPEKVGKDELGSILDQDNEDE